MSTLSATIKVRLDEQARAELERIAQASDRSTGAIVRIAIREYLNRHAHSRKAADGGR